MIDKTDAEIVQLPTDETKLVDIDRTSWRWIVGLKLAESLLDLCEISPSQAADFLAISLASVQDYREAKSLQFWVPVLDRPDPTLIFELLPVAHSA